MRWLVDAQLPKRLATHLANFGHDALHTLDFPMANRSPDSEVCSRADREDRIVITKDSDFVNSHILSDTPKRLLLVSTGNIGNRSLLALFDSHLSQIAAAFDTAVFVELTPSHIVIRQSSQ